MVYTSEALLDLDEYLSEFTGLYVYLSRTTGSI